MPAKSREQIALEYGICRKTLNKWLKCAGLNVPKGLINPQYQKIIYDEFGVPGYTAELQKHNTKS